jgi:hypothetical protein
MTNPTTADFNLLISDKPDPERDALADAFRRVLADRISAAGLSDRPRIGLLH